jgi:hypothetical protein
MSKLQPNFHVLHRCGYIGEGERPPVINENHSTKGETKLSRNQNDPEVLLPPNVVEETELNVNAIKENWKGFEGLPPAEILQLITGQPIQAKKDGGDDVEMLLPPGVV